MGIYGLEGFEIDDSEVNNVPFSVGNNVFTQFTHATNRSFDCTGAAGEIEANCNLSRCRDINKKESLILKVNRLIEIRNYFRVILNSRIFKLVFRIHTHAILKFLINKTFNV